MALPKASKLPQFDISEIVVVKTEPEDKKVGDPCDNPYVLFGVGLLALSPIIGLMAWMLIAPQRPAQ